MKNIIYIVCLLIPFNVRANWNGTVYNYNKNDLAGNGGQTWQIREYDENHIYFGNRNGLLEFNGPGWRLFPLETHNNIRSICVSHRLHRILAGGEGEFGYFEPDGRGQLTYTRLSGELHREENISGEYWGVYEVDNMIYYVSDRYIVKQIDNDFRLITSEAKIDCSNIVNGTLYLGTTAGVKMLVGNTILPVPGENLPEGTSVRAIVPCQGGCLIATAYNGLFHASTTGIVPCVTGSEEFMRRNEVFSLALSTDYIAVGTIQKGLLLIDRNSMEVSYYNEQNGLQNNTVLSLCFDSRDNLWLGLDNGIDYIALHSPYSKLHTFPDSYGTGYAALQAGRRLFFGTNRGLFYTDNPTLTGENPVNLQLFSALSGQVWGIANIDNEIFCLHDKGLYLIEGDRAELVPGLRGAIMCTALNTNRQCLVGTYEGLFLIAKAGGQWRIKQKIETAVWARNFVFIPPDTLWIRSISNGMVRMKLDTTDFSVKEERLYDTSSGFESLDELYAHPVKGKAFFSTASGIYEYDQASDRIIPARELSGALLAGKSYTAIVAKGDYLYALSHDMVQVAPFRPDGSLSPARVFPFHTPTDFIRYYETLEVINDSLVIIPNENGFALLNTKVAPAKTVQELFIKSVYVTYPKDSLVYVDNYLLQMPKLKIAYKQHALRFEYAVRSFGTDNQTKYRLRLNSDYQWSDYSTATVKEFNNLKEGDYLFEVEALFSDGNRADAHFEFTILPPWYRSAYALSVYLLLFLLLIYGIRMEVKRRTRRKVEAERIERNKEISLKEETIIKLENEKLEQELSFKSQEIANLMIHFSRKNEILIDIKRELYKVIAEMNGETFTKVKRMLLTLSNSIDSNIESDDALKRFEEQFNIVHNNFIDKLRNKHPDLSLGELMMCVYIKMNLLTKEMAPLLNLSVRGVETLRYRVRKKIGLEHEDSLTDYLNSLARQSDKNN